MSPSTTGLETTGSASIGILIVVLGIVALGIALVFLWFSRRHRRGTNRR
jgi:flagellar basal body-associated protein FliL